MVDMCRIVISRINLMGTLLRGPNAPGRAGRNWVRWGGNAVCVWTTWAGDGLVWVGQGVCWRA